MAEAAVMPGAEDIDVGSGPAGALLVHGFTSTPQSLRPLGERLASVGMRVSGPRLPGHGTAWEDLNRRDHRDWTAAVEGAYLRLSAACDEVFVVAMSFGVALAVDLCARRPGGVAGLVAISGLVATRDPRRHLAAVIRRITPTVAGVANDIADPTGKELAYDVLPTAATHSMLRFLRRARTALPRVTCPVLVMQSRRDHVVEPRNAVIIHDSVGAADRRIVWYERSYHVLTLDYDRADVYEQTVRFVKEHSRHDL